MFFYLQTNWGKLLLQLYPKLINNMSNKLVNCPCGISLLRSLDSKPPYRCLAHKEAEFGGDENHKIISGRSHKKIYCVMCNKVLWVLRESKKACDRCTRKYGFEYVSTLTPNNLKRIVNDSVL